MDNMSFKFVLKFPNNHWISFIQQRSFFKQQDLILFHKILLWLWTFPHPTPNRKRPKTSNSFSLITFTFKQSKWNPSVGRSFEPLATSGGNYRRALSAHLIIEQTSPQSALRPLPHLRPCHLARSRECRAVSDTRETLWRGRWHHPLTLVEKWVLPG